MVLLLAFALAIAPPPSLAPATAAGAALCLASMGLFATAALPEYVTAILFFGAAMLFQVAPAEVVFAGFHSTAFWLVFGGLVIGLGVDRTGLARRLADAIAGRLAASYVSLIAGLVAVGVGLAFVIPATMGRTLVLLPIVLAMAEGFGFRQGSNGRTGMVLAASFGTLLPGFAILPATVPAMVLAGASEALYGISPAYGSYLLLHFPVLGLLKAVAIVALVVWLFPDRLTPRDADVSKRPLSRDELIMAFLLAAALLSWITDFLHHVSPAWIALAAAAVCLLPWPGLVPAQAFSERLNLGPLFYVAGVLGLGALIASSGVDDLIAGLALPLLDLAPGEAPRTFAAIAATSSLLAMLLTQPSVPVVMTPLSGTIAEAAGLPVATVLMMQVVGFSTLILPYQTPPLIVAMRLANVPIAQANRLCIWLLAVSVLVLLPLDLLWWRLLGWLAW